MIELCDGDLFESGAQALVNAVNANGVMGRGIAAEFKSRYPVYFRTYEHQCALGLIRPGVVMIYNRENPPVGEPGWIITFPTKQDWRNPSKLEWIEQGLASLIEKWCSGNARQQRPPFRPASIAFPALGCGLGGLAWNDVRPLIEAAFAPLPDVRVLLYGPR